MARKKARKDNIKPQLKTDRENAHPGNYKFAAITAGLFCSEARRTLPLPAVALYIYCVLQIEGGEPQPGKPKPIQYDVQKEHGKIAFKITETMLKKEFRSAAAMRRHIDTLIEHGFIDCKDHGGQGWQKPCVYELSDRWRAYGTEAGKPLPKQCTRTLLRKLYPEHYKAHYSDTE